MGFFFEFFIIISFFGFVSSAAVRISIRLYKKQVDARKQLVDGGFDKDKIHILL